jgi:hypothetical protein
MVAWGSSDQDELANQLGTVDDNLLGNHAADGEAEKVDLLQAESIDESLCALRAIPAKVDGTSPDRACDSRVVEENDFSLRSQAIENGGIPIIKIACEVLVEDERNAARFAPTSVSEADPVCLDELSGDGDCCVCLMVCSFDDWVGATDLCRLPRVDARAPTAQAKALRPVRLKPLRKVRRCG